MSGGYHGKLLTLFILTLLTITSQALPKCDRNDEDCRERFMHPDLPNEPPKDVVNSRAYETEKSNDYWLNQGKEFIKEKLTAQLNTKRAKNVILFLGDGMGLTTIAATRNLLGGEEKSLAFEKFPYTGLSKTYAIDKIVSDSACTATAYLCGIKANEGTIGVNGHVQRDDCLAMQDQDNYVYSIAKWAMDVGKSAGVVTTTRITHASPAGVYAHTAERDWENDSELKEDCGSDSTAQDIAYQLIHGEVGSKLKFVMGGGKKHFIDSSLYEKGERSDGRNLINDYKQQNAKNLYVETHEQLMNANLDEAERVFGLYQDSHLLYHLETNETTTQPTLEEMTRKAIEYLSKNDEGYFIFIEGGRIDLAHHDNMARIALDEAVEFSKAIDAAREMTSEDDTLIVVTADHSHAFSYAGYPYRGSDIFSRTVATPDDQKPFLVLSYANGPSYDTFYDVEKHERRDPLQVLTGDAHDSFPSTLPLDSETHGGDDVAVYASGPWSHLFTGVYEQNAIPHMMGYAACLGEGLKVCDSP
ncbi:membrane-bound alkaline phosphatase-like [Teleopsis dalmanni]|uniref:membrane-bound alkaline phosphatase-like n=1 Tax=Teleopsis dalmanni TaxID=139649 RepID=UPI0018CD545B|nr:membrane-bound alkaline phosphatase-like [Teleopsis dalmanni]